MSDNIDNPNNEENREDQRDLTPDDRPGPNRSNCSQSGDGKPAPDGGMDAADDSPETHAEKELEVLKHISEQEGVHQRDLAQIVGMSLGMTNAILKRLSKKGLLTIRKVNNRNIRYAVTSEGMEEIARRSYRYFRRTIKNVVYYRDAIEELMGEVKQRGFTTVALVGESDMDFIVEHLCWKYGMTMVRRDDSRNGHADGSRAENETAGAGRQTFILHSERKPVPRNRARTQQRADGHRRGDGHTDAAPGGSTTGHTLQEAFLRDVVTA